MKSDCGSPSFAVCLRSEHNCGDCRYWYYEHRMWWYVTKCQQRVEREERDFRRMLLKVREYLDEDKEERFLLAGTDSD